MVNWFTGKQGDTVGRINFEQRQEPVIVPQAKKRMQFVEFEGATAETDEYTGKLIFNPRGKIHINVEKIGGFYDHTILLFGNKIRVMETEAQIYMKIKEAEQ